MWKIFFPKIKPTIQSFLKEKTFNLFIDNNAINVNTNNFTIKHIHS